MSNIASMTYIASMKIIALLILAAITTVGFAQSASTFGAPIKSGSVTATVRKFLFQPDPSGPVLATVSVCAVTSNENADAMDISLSYQLADGTVLIKSVTVQVPSVGRDQPVCENFWLIQGRLLSVSFQEKAAPIILSGFDMPVISSVMQ